VHPCASTVTVGGSRAVVVPPGAGTIRGVLAVDALGWC
jgi:hypothetical protein